MDKLSNGVSGSHLSNAKSFGDYSIAESLAMQLQDSFLERCRSHG
mgnify:CR=1 FL=1